MKQSENIIALLTDFGLKDYFVGAMKGVILNINENAKIIDITHEIPPQDILSAEFCLRACYKNFPSKTIFVVVVDPGVGSERRAILVETEDHYFIAPDNGLLSFIFTQEKILRVIELINDDYFNKPVSNTFHGRDIFSPVAAHLSSGVLPVKFGNEIKSYFHEVFALPINVDQNTIEAEIIHIDHFGNLITNLTKNDLPESFIMEIGQKVIEKHQDYFAEAEISEIFMIHGSAGFLEIVSYKDSAEKILEIKVGQKVYVKKMNQ